MSATSATAEPRRMTPEAVQHMLDTNAQLIKLCVELQNSPWPTAKQELVKAQARLQQNLGFLAQVATASRQQPSTLSAGKRTTSLGSMSTNASSESIATATAVSGNAASTALTLGAAAHDTRSQQALQQMQMPTSPRRVPHQPRW